MFYLAKFYTLIYKGGYSNIDFKHNNIGQKVKKHVIQLRQKATYGTLLLLHPLMDCAMLQELWDFVNLFYYIPVAYRGKSCVRNSSYTRWWILSIHSDQDDMKIAVEIGIWDVASFTWVMGLCHSLYYLAYRGNSSNIPRLILFILIHSCQHDMEMTVKTAICDAASFTWVMGLCHTKINICSI